MTYYAVIGRIPFDDEDSVYFYENVEEDVLWDLFTESMYADSGRTDQEEVEAECGAPVYINHILAAEAPIIQR